MALLDRVVPVAQIEDRAAHIDLRRMWLALAIVVPFFVVWVLARATVYIGRAFRQVIAAAQEGWAGGRAAPRKPR